MREVTVSNIKIQYPDEMSFAFIPTVLNFENNGDFIDAVGVYVSSGDTVYSEEREMFLSSGKQTCFFDIRSLMQACFENGDKRFEQLKEAYGTNITVEISFHKADTTVGQFTFQTYCIWGAIEVGERFNDSRTLKRFVNYPMTVDIYNSEGGSIYEKKADGTYVLLSVDSGFLFLVPTEDTIGYYQINAGGFSVFDHTFDFTFAGLDINKVDIDFEESECADGIYLRWISRHGNVCYYLFKVKETSNQIRNVGEFIRMNMTNNMYNKRGSVVNRQQEKDRAKSMLAYVSLVDSATYDFLLECTSSPIVDMYVNGQWVSVNINSFSAVKTKSELQDFEMTVLLNEINTQKL